MDPAFPVIGRLAPSPTGFLHLGHARSFLLAFWHTRSRGGRLVLRLEDVDASRASQAHIEHALEDLDWLGISWDGPPVVQSEHLGRVHQAVAELVDRHLVYPCVCTRRDLQGPQGEEVRGAPQAGVSEPRYPGTCRGRYSSLEQAERETGRSAGLRLVTPDEEVRFLDQVYGEQSFNVARDVGDFLVLRRDKTPSYQLAVTVSDAVDRVTEVLRGADLLASTARQLLLYRALGLSPPSFAHLPLVCDASGRRLAKRADDLSLRELRSRGVDPREVVTWAACSAGQVPTDAAAGWLTAEEIARTFDLRKLTLDPVRVSDDAWRAR